MNAYALLAIVGGVIGILPIVWRAKGSQVFLLLCAGSLLSASLGGSLTNEIRSAASTENIPIQNIVSGVLLLLPAALALILSRGSVKKRKAPFHVLPSLAAGVLAYLWFIRILPFDQFSVLENAEVTKQLLQIRDTALVAGILSSLALVFIDRPKSEDLDGKKKGK
jgi:hypothetical protein